MKLDDSIYKEILSLTNLAETYFEKDNYSESIVTLLKAEKLLPIPKEKWDAACWIYTAIGDSSFFQQDYNNSIKYFELAHKSSGGIGNAFIHLRLGQAYYESNLRDLAISNLLQAYMLEGRDIFADEEEKYLFFLESKVNL